MFQSLGLLVLVSLSVAVELQNVTGSKPGTVSPPENLSILWISDFIQELSWAPPQNLTNCTPEYQAIAQPREYKEIKIRTTEENKQLFDLEMDGRFLYFSVKTLCGAGRESDPVFLNITYPELVRNVHCYIRSSSKANCSWQLASHLPNLSFFYWLIDESGKLADKTPKDLQECPSYSYTDGNRTGCDLQMDMGHAILMVFKGTLNNTIVRNTFRNNSIEVRLPPLNWTVIKAGDKFNISWIPPFSELDKWKFTINYTECDKRKSEVIKENTSTQLDRVAHCQYQMTIKAEHEYRTGGTEESKKKYFDADPSPVVYVVILIPLMFAGLAVLLFVYCRRHKESIFPKVPEPRDLLSDISDNNNKITVRNLYIPAEEEEDCKITLVVDPQLSKPHC